MSPFQVEFITASWAFNHVFSLISSGLISLKQIKAVSSEGTPQEQSEMEAIVPSDSGEIFSSLHLGCVKFIQISGKIGSNNSACRTVSDKLMPLDIHVSIFPIFRHRYYYKSSKNFYFYELQLVHTQVWLT